MNSRFAIRWVFFFVGTCASAETQLDVRVVHGGIRELVIAETVAGEIMRQVDVRVNWSLAGTVPPQAGTDGAVYLKILAGTPAAERPGAFGYAFPYAHQGVRVVIYYDRVLKVARTHSVPVSRVLGHAIAHELGHLLRGDRSHADSGLMRPHWTAAEFGLLRQTTLAFAEPDILQIAGRQFSQR